MTMIFNGAFVVLMILLFVAIIARFEAATRPKTKVVGRIIVNTKDVDKDVFRMELDLNPADLANLSEVVFEIVNE